MVAEMPKSLTTIRVSTELREKLKKLGTKGDTYEQIIERILEKASNDAGESHGRS